MAETNNVSNKVANEKEQTIDQSKDQLSQNIIQSNIKPSQTTLKQTQPSVKLSKSTNPQAQPNDQPTNYQPELAIQILQPANQKSEIHVETPQTINQQPLLAVLPVNRHEIDTFQQLDHQPQPANQQNDKQNQQTEQEKQIIANVPQISINQELDFQINQKTKAISNNLVNEPTYQPADPLKQPAEPTEPTHQPPRESSLKHTFEYPTNLLEIPVKKEIDHTLLEAANSNPANQDTIASVASFDIPDIDHNKEEKDKLIEKLKNSHEKEEPAICPEPIEPDEPLIQRIEEGKESPDEKLILEEPGIVPIVRNSLDEDALFFKTYKFPFPFRFHTEGDLCPEGKLIGKFHILLLGDKFEYELEGISAINRSLATDLVKTKAGSVTSTVFVPIEELSEESRKAASDLNIKLLSLAQPCEYYYKIDMGEEGEPDIYREIVTQPDKYTNIFYTPEPSHTFHSYTHIVGHMPLTHEYALCLKKTTFRPSKLIMFFHTIPSEMLSYKTSKYCVFEIPTLERLVEVAQASRVVYSVSKKLFDYYTIVFRTFQVVINHKLYLPIAPPEIRNLSSHNHFYNHINFLSNGVFCNSSQDCIQTNGFDLTINIITKLFKQKLRVPDSEDFITLKLFLTHLPPDKLKVLRSELKKFGNHCLLSIEPHIDTKNFKHLYKLSNFYLEPRRGENYGFSGLFPFYVGMPGLVPEDSITASILLGLSDISKEFIVPMTKNPVLYKQNATVWFEKLLHFIQNYDEILEKARELKALLIADENSRNTHDDFLSSVVEGIDVNIRVLNMVPLDAKEKDKRGLKMNFEQMLLKVLRVCWRVKNKAYQDDIDPNFIGSQIARGVVFPIELLIKNVFNKLEEYNRKVVALNEEKVSLVVFCPNLFSLRHLWAICSAISGNLMDILDNKGECDSLVNSLKIESVSVELIIEGSDFLKASKFIEEVYEKM